MNKIIGSILLLLFTTFIAYPVLANDNQVDVNNSLETTNTMVGGNQGMTFNSKGSDPKRGFAIPGQIEYPPVIPDMTNTQDWGPLYTHINVLLGMFSGNYERATFTRQELETIIKYSNGGFSKPQIEPRYFDNTLPKVDKIEVVFKIYRFDKNKNIAINDDPRPDGFRRIGLFHGWAKKDGQLTIDVLAMALINAMDHGSNCAAIIGQGAVKKTVASSRGIGTSFVTATINEGSQTATSAVGGGGFGFSWANAKSIFLPWNQAVLGYVPE